MRETPGLIPNPEAKPHSADGTAHGSVWESRTPPNTPLAQSFWVWVQGDSAPKTVWFWGHTCIPTRFGVLVFCGWLVGWLVGSCVLCFVVGVGGGFPEGPAAAPPRTVGGATRHAGLSICLCKRGVHR